MFRALLKKQTLELLSFLFKSHKGGGRRSHGGMVLFAALMIYVVGFFGVVFYMMANTLCAPLISVGLDWMFFALMAGSATVLGVIGSVFSTQSQLYDAKDNELLLSMPIPPYMLLMSRMLSLYIQTFFFEAMVLVPSCIVYFKNAGFNIDVILLMLLLPLVALALSCILGWLVALITSRLKNKSLFSVLLSVAFLAAYFYLYSRMNSIINSILLNSELLGQKIKSSAYVLYTLGRAACGDPAAFLMTALLCVGVFAIVYAVLAVSFIKIVTSKRTGKKRKYVKGEMREGTPRSALFKKELRRYCFSPGYIMNSSLGTVFMIAGAVYLFIKGGSLYPMLASVFPEMKDALPLLGCAAVSMLTTTNDLTAPSVSLEGKSLWLTRSLPIDTRLIFDAKLSLHLIITAPAAVLCMVAAAVATRSGFAMASLSVVAVLLVTVLMALMGLAINLKLPNFTWVNETAAVKQSASVGIALFGGWGAVILPVLGYLPVYKFISPVVYLLICIAVFGTACALLYKWIMTRGKKIFNNL